MDGKIMKSFFCVFLIYSIILPGIFGTSLLVVLPHISHSHYLATSKLVIALHAKGHNVTVIAPYQMGLEEDNITEIYINGIVDHIKRFQWDFFENENDPSSFWSKLQYTRGLGFEYASRVLNNKNVTDLIESNSTFDLVLVEDMSADALTIFSHIFKCPLIVLLAEPLSLYYDNYFSDNIGWKKYNEPRNVHHYAIKELYRRWIVLPEQNKIIRDIYPDTPDVAEVLYNTSLVLIPSYPSLNSLFLKYSNVKEIGGFHIDNHNQMSGIGDIDLNNSKESVVLMSEDLTETNVKLLFENTTLWTSNVDAVQLLGHGNVELFVGNGDIYDTASAVYNGIPVLSVSYNEWFQHFLIDKLVEDNFAFGVPVDKLEWKYMQAVESSLRNSSYQKEFKLASEILRSEQSYVPIDKAIYWIEYVIRFNGASHLRPNNLRQQLNRHLIEIIILLVIIDIALFLLFYWIIKHTAKVFHAPKKIYDAVRKVFNRKNDFSNYNHVKYIQLEK